jgi:large repetitive protein
VRAADRAGNTDATPAVAEFTVDTRSPAVTLTSTPGEFTNDTTPTFNFQVDDDGATAQCRFDQAAFGPCSAPRSHTPASGLPEGSHVFEVRATDRSGNVSSASQFSFTIDTTVPDTTITQSPARLTTNSTPSFSFTSTEANSDFKCALDNFDYQPCTDPYQAATLTEGYHVFRVRAADRAGNTDATPAVAEFTVDTPPTVTITSGPPPTSRNDLPTFEFAIDDETATVKCRFDEGAFGPCSAPRSHTPGAGLAEGSHVFEIRATDRRGNTSDPVIWSFVIDVTIPETRIVSGPPSSSTKRSPSFSFASSEEAVSYECALDKGSFSACGNPYRTRVSKGRHLFQVRAIDPAGNVEQEPAKYRFRVTGR